MKGNLCLLGKINAKEKNLMPADKAETEQKP